MGWHCILAHEENVQKALRATPWVWCHHCHVNLALAVLAIDPGLFWVFSNQQGCPLVPNVDLLLSILCIDPGLLDSVLSWSKLNQLCRILESLQLCINSQILTQLVASYWACMLMWNCCWINCNSRASSWPSWKRSWRTLAHHPFWLNVALDLATNFHQVVCQ